MNQKHTQVTNLYAKAEIQLYMLSTQKGSFLPPSDASGLQFVCRFHKHNMEQNIGRVIYKEPLYLSISLSLSERMMDNTIIVTFLILNFVLSLVFRRVIDFITKFHHFIVKSAWSAATGVEQLTPKDDLKGTARESPVQECKSCKRLVRSLETWFIGAGEEVCSADDIEIVMDKLGMVIFWEEDKMRYDGKCRDCRLLEGTIFLLKNKEATLEDISKSFLMFDTNRDGFISPNELQAIMHKLGIKEGMELEDCKKMIQVFDKDGNGMIDFSEFKEMMDNVI